MKRHMRCALSLATMTTTAVIGFSLPASAHVGDHSHLDLAELMDHLVAGLDHRLTIMTAVLVITVAGVSVLRVRRKGRGRSPERSAT